MEADLRERLDELKTSLVEASAFLYDRMNAMRSAGEFGPCDGLRELDEAIDELACAIEDYIYIYAEGASL